jgi:hypothetical protein
MAENTKIIISAVDKTKKGFKSVTNGLKTVTKAVFSMKSALGLAAGGAAMGLLIKKSFDAVDSLDKTASKIGVTTQALTKLHYAAGLTGVSVETLNMASQRFTRRLAEAARGTGEAKGALKELGINADELKKKQLDEQMLSLADAFSKVTTSADKVRLAMKLFDSEGVSLVNTLNLGRDGLKELFQEAETLGIVLSGRAVGGIVKAKDAMTKLFTLFKGVRDQLTAALAPALEMLVTLLKDKILGAIEKANGSIEEFANKTIKSLIIGVGNMILALANGLRAFIDFANEISTAAQRVAKFFDETVIVNENVFSKSLVTKIQNVGNAIVGWGNGMSFAFGELNKGNKPLEDQITLLDRLKTAFVSVEDQFPTLDEGMKKVANSMSGAITKGFTDAITGAEKFSDAMKAMAKSVIDSLIEMLVQYYITQAIFGAITGAFPSGPSVATTAPNTNMGANLGSRSFNGGGFTGMGSRSGGVDNKGGFAAILHPNETVVDHTTGQSSGGVVVNQTINVTTGVQQTVRAEIVQLMPQIAQAAKGAVADARLRGGNFSKAMGGA